MTKRVITDPALIILHDAIAFEKRKLKSREWSAEIVTAVEAKIKSYEETFKARDKIVNAEAGVEAIVESEQAVNNSGN